MIQRSYKKITNADLLRLGKIAFLDHEGLFRRRPLAGQLYRGQLLVLALCQGAAQHYIDDKTGIKDFDIWSFYKASSVKQFPPRRRGVLDFGDPKFGKSEESPQFIGRRVDHMGRSISDADFSNPVAVLQRYLRNGRTKSSRCLAHKAVVLIKPDNLLGKVIWPEGLANQ